MKLYKHTLFPFMVVVTVVLLNLNSQAQASDSVTITANTSSIRVTPAFHAKSIATASKGTRLKRLLVNKDWIKVKYNGAEGWVHQSDIAGTHVKNSSTREFRNSGLDKDVLKREAALAGKGVDETNNQDLEKLLKQKK